jgi:hypothetical protein
VSVHRPAPSVSGTPSGAVVVAEAAGSQDADIIAGGSQLSANLVRRRRCRRSKAQRLKGSSIGYAGHCRQVK